MIAGLLAICTSASAYQAIPKSKEMSLINSGYSVVNSNEKEMSPRKTYFKSGRVQTMVIMKRWVRLETSGEGGGDYTNLGGGWSMTTVAQAGKKTVELVIYYVKTTQSIKVPSIKYVNVPVNLDEVQPVIEKPATAHER
jgi:hypothetical protein